jgi:hypothetical protein
MTNKLENLDQDQLTAEDIFFGRENALEKKQKNDAHIDQTVIDTRDQLESVTESRIDTDAQHIIDSLTEEKVLPESPSTPRLTAFLRFLKEIGVNVRINGTTIPSDKNLSTVELTTASLKRFLEKGLSLAPVLYALLKAKTAFGGQVEIINETLVQNVSNAPIDVGGHLPTYITSHPIATTAIGLGALTAVILSTIIGEPPTTLRSGLQPITSFACPES